jgi:hypothetical protein
VHSGVPSSAVSTGACVSVTGCTSSASRAPTDRTNDEALFQLNVLLFTLYGAFDGAARVAHHAYALPRSARNAGWLWGNWLRLLGKAHRLVELASTSIRLGCRNRTRRGRHSQKVTEGEWRSVHRGTPLSDGHYGGDYPRSLRLPDLRSCHWRVHLGSGQGRARRQGLAEASRNPPPDEDRALA